MATALDLLGEAAEMGPALLAAAEADDQETLAERLDHREDLLARAADAPGREGADPARLRRLLDRLRGDDEALRHCLHKKRAEVLSALGSLREIRRRGSRPGRLDRRA